MMKTEEPKLEVESESESEEDSSILDDDPLNKDDKMVECPYGCDVLLECENDKAFHIVWRHHEVSTLQGTKYYVCPECWTCFLKDKLDVTWQSIVVHLAYKCTAIKSSYRCRICRQNFDPISDSAGRCLEKCGRNLEIDIREHMDIHKHSSTSQYYLSFFPNEYDKDSVISCEQCDYMTTNKKNLNKHIVSNHEGICFPCEQCNYKGTTKQNLKSHFEAQHEGIRYPCDQCKYQATLKANLKTHMASQHGGFLYCCEQCDYMTNNKYYLKSHMTTHEGETFQKKKKIKTEDKLRRRIESQNMSKVICCTICEYKTTKKSALNKHLKVHQQSSNRQIRQSSKY